MYLPERRQEISQGDRFDIELDVLYVVHVHDHLARTRLAEYAAIFLGSADPEQSFTLSEYEAAVEACINKGWLKVLTAEDCEQDRLRWQNDLNQSFGEHKYKVGDVDFTVDGARLFYGVQVEKDIAKGKRPFHSHIGYAWNVPGQVRVFGAYADEVEQNVEAILTGEASLGDYSLQIERVEGPFAIGPWWLNRFVQLSDGYRADIYYTADADIAEEDGGSGKTFLT